MNTEEPMEDWRAEAMLMKEMLKFGKIVRVVGNITRVGENFNTFHLHVTNTHVRGTIFQVEGMPNIIVNSMLSKYWTPMGQYSVVECSLVTNDPLVFVEKSELEGKKFEIF